MSERAQVRRATGTEETTTAAEGTSCPECGATVRTDDERGESYCTACGVVVAADAVDRGPEWRAFDRQERNRKSRVGAPTTKMLHDEGLSTVIDWQDRDAHGRAIDGKKRARLRRMRRWDERFRSTDARDRNLKQALGEIDRMASALGLPENVRETASVVYRRALDADLLPGRSIEAMATASLYAAGRQAGIPRSLDEFEPVSRVERREFARAYRYVARELGLTIQPSSPRDYLPRFASSLELSDEATTLARELLAAGRERSVHSGKNPVGLAAAALYAGAKLANEDVTQRDVGDVADVSEVTIRNRYQELLEAKESLD
ncbi:MAG: transcription initiation factor IIB family protein [Haloferacaceae archaeon]